VIEAGLAGALYFSSLLAAAAAAAAASSLCSVRSRRLPPLPSCPLTLLPRLNFFLCSRTGREISGTSIASQRERGAACARGIDANSRRAYSALPRRRAEKASRRSRGHRSVRRGALARCTVRSKFAFVALALFALRDAKLDKA